MTDLQRAKLWRRAYENEIAELDRAITATRERLAELEEWRAQSVTKHAEWSAKVAELESGGGPPS